MLGIAGVGEDGRPVHRRDRVVRRVIRHDRDVPAVAPAGEAVGRGGAARRVAAHVVIRVVDVVLADEHVAELRARDVLIGAVREILVVDVHPRGAQIVDVRDDLRGAGPVDRLVEGQADPAVAEDLQRAGRRRRVVSDRGELVAVLVELDQLRAGIVPVDERRNRLAAVVEGRDLDVLRVAVGDLVGRLRHDLVRGRVVDRELDLAVRAGRIDDRLVPRDGVAVGRVAEPELGELDLRQRARRAGRELLGDVVGRARRVGAEIGRDREALPVGGAVEPEARELEEVLVGGVVVGRDRRDVGAGAAAELPGRRRRDAAHIGVGEQRLDRGGDAAVRVEHLELDAVGLRRRVVRVPGDAVCAEDVVRRAQVGDQVVERAGDSALDRRRRPDRERTIRIEPALDHVLLDAGVAALILRLVERDRLGRRRGRVRKDHRRAERELLHGEGRQRLRAAGAGQHERIDRQEALRDRVGSVRVERRRRVAVSERERVCIERAAEARRPVDVRAGRRLRREREAAPQVADRHEREIAAAAPVAVDRDRIAGERARDLIGQHLVVGLGDRQGRAADGRALHLRVREIDGLAGREPIDRAGHRGGLRQHERAGRARERHDPGIGRDEVELAAVGDRDGLAAVRQRPEHRELVAGRRERAGVGARVGGRRERDRLDVGEGQRARMRRIARIGERDGAILILGDRVARRRVGQDRDVPAARAAREAVGRAGVGRAVADVIVGIVDVVLADDRVVVARAGEILVGPVVERRIVDVEARRAQVEDLEVELRGLVRADDVVVGEADAPVAEVLELDVGHRRRIVDRREEAARRVVLEHIGRGVVAVDEQEIAAAVDGDGGDPHLLRLAVSDRERLSRNHVAVPIRQDELDLVVRAGAVRDGLVPRGAVDAADLHELQRRCAGARVGRVARLDLVGDRVDGAGREIRCEREIDAIGRAVEVVAREHHVIEAGLRIELRIAEQVAVVGDLLETPRRRRDRAGDARDVERRDDRRRRGTVGAEHLEARAVIARAVVLVPRDRVARERRRMRRGIVLQKRDTGRIDRVGADICDQRRCAGRGRR